MDTRDGTIHQLTAKEIAEQLDPFMVPVDMDYATSKQRAEQKVSLKDHRSPLGKKLTEERRNKGLTKNYLRKLRRQGRLR